MSKPDRSGVIRFADAKGRIPSPESDHAVSLLERGTLKVKLSIPAQPTAQTPHRRMSCTSWCVAGVCWFTVARESRSRQAICYLSPQGPSIKSKLSLTSPCGLFSMA